MKIRSRLKETIVENVTDLFSLKTFLTCKKNSCVFLIDEKVYALYRDPIDRFTGDRLKILVPVSEESKTLPYVMTIYQTLFENDFKRGDTLFTIGGGVLQDIGGFIAATVYRGVKWIHAPTTLVSQADSCIGSKVALNFNSWKNQIGTFYPPDEIYIDAHFISTLSERDFRSGLGEIIKVHLMERGESFEWLSTYLNSKDLGEVSNVSQLIVNSLRIKKTYVEADEFDFGKRNLLNYGHCFGHALESASHFSISHGEAVLLGIVFANLISSFRGILKDDENQKIEKEIRRYVYKFDFSSICVSHIISNMKRDKKRVGKKLSMILLHEVGLLQKHDDVEEDEIQKVYENFPEYIMQLTWTKP